MSFVLCMGELTALFALVNTIVLLSLGLVIISSLKQLTHGRNRVWSIRSSLSLIPHSRNLKFPILELADGYLIDLPAAHNIV